MKFSWCMWLIVLICSSFLAHSLPYKLGVLSYPFFDGLGKRPSNFWISFSAYSQYGVYSSTSNLYDSDARVAGKPITTRVTHVLFVLIRVFQYCTYFPKSNIAKYTFCLTEFMRDWSNVNELYWVTKNISFHKRIVTSNPFTFSRIKIRQAFTFQVPEGNFILSSPVFRLVIAFKTKGTCSLYDSTYYYSEVHGEHAPSVKVSHVNGKSSIKLDEHERKNLYVEIVKIQ